MEQTSFLDLAIEKAKNEKKILICEQFGNGYNIPYTYNHGYYLDFDNIDVFCNKLYLICREIYGYGGKIPYDFPDMFNSDNFTITIDYNNVIVYNFSNVNMEDYENYIMNYFKEMCI